MAQPQNDPKTGDNSNMTRKDTGVTEEKNNVPQPPDNPSSKPPMYAEDPKTQGSRKAPAQ